MTHDPDGVLAMAGPSRPPLPCDWGALSPGTLISRRDAIRIYVRLGLHPIAVHGIRDGRCTCNSPTCQKPGKHPVLRAWQRAPLDLEELDRMLVSQWRDNVGLRMGRQPDGSCLVCLDVDGSRDLLAPLEAEHGQLPPTLTARTGSGGWHLVYRVPPDRAPRNRVGMAPGVDVRAEGGQIVVAPSRHASGGEYRWTECREPAWLFGGPGGAR